MSARQIVKVLLVFGLSFSVAKSVEPDYYWRDYNGTLPEDAIEGGLDLDGNPTYIGQAFVLHHGVLIGEIHPGQKTIITSKQGIHRTDLYNKVLCGGHKDNFSWIQANAATLHLTTSHEQLVPGGMEWGKVLSIGRAKHGGRLIVGKVCSGTIGNALLYFPFYDIEVDKSSYEVLTYHNNKSAILKEYTN